MCVCVCGGGGGGGGGVKKHKAVDESTVYVHEMYISFKFQYEKMQTQFLTDQIHVYMYL